MVSMGYLILRLRKEGIRVKPFIYGYFGFGNVGDEAIMSSVISRCREKRREPIVLTNNVQSSLRTQKANYLLGLPLLVAPGWRGTKYKLGYWVRYGWKLFPSLIANDNVIIYACGGSINDHVIGRVVDFKKRVEGMKSLGFKVALLGAGVDPLISPQDRAAAKALVTELVDYCSLRDEESAASLREVGVPSSCFEVTTDVVFGMDVPCIHSVSNGTLEEARVALNLRPLFDNHKERGDNKQNRYENYVAACNKLIATLSRQTRELVLFPYSPEDFAFMKVLSLPAGVRLEPFSSSLNEVLNKTCQSDIVVGMRFHAIIFSILCGVPCLPLPYSHKVINLANRLGINYRELVVGDGSHVADQIFSVDAIIRELNVLVKGRKNIVKQYKRFADENRHLAKADFDKCWQVLSAKVR